MKRLLEGLFAVVALSVALSACSSPLPDVLEDVFPSSATELATLQHVSYTGQISGAPLECPVSIGRLADRSLLINSGFAPLVFKRVASDGAVRATHGTSIGADVGYFRTCVTSATRSGIAVVIDAPTLQIWFVGADGSVRHNDLMSDVSPVAVHSNPSEGHVIAGRTTDGTSVVIRIGQDLQLLWSTHLENHTIRDVTVASDGSVVAAGHVGEYGYAEEMAASVIVLDAGGQVTNEHTYSPRRWAPISHITPLAGDRYLLYGENQGGGYIHTWVAVIDRNGNLMWDNEDTWEEWYKASMPSRLLAVEETGKGSLILLATDLRLVPAGSDQKTTVVGDDGVMRTQTEWMPIAGQPGQNIVIDGSTAFAVYTRRVGSSMSGHTSFEAWTRLYRLR